MSEENYLLTEEFISFSQKIKEVFERKKVKKKELKDFYEKIQAEIKEIDLEATKLEKEFEDWKNSK